MLVPALHSRLLLDGGSRDIFHPVTVFIPTKHGTKKESPLRFFHSKWQHWQIVFNQIILRSLKPLKRLSELNQLRSQIPGASKHLRHAYTDLMHSGVHVVAVTEAGVDILSVNKMLMSLLWDTQTEQRHVPRLSIRPAVAIGCRRVELFPDSDRTQSCEHERVSKAYTTVTGGDRVA